MGKYSIKDLEFLSGIKAHTLRVWEQRYKVLKPKRSETNIRYYSDDDLKYLLNISLLYNSDYRISQIAGWSRDEVANKVYEISQNTYDHNSQINALTISMIEMDEERFEKVISTNILQFGFEKTMITLVHPFLKKIGILWQTGAINPAHEHFITNLIRQKLFVAIDGQMVDRSTESKKYLLFLPEGETHEIGLLFANFILKSRRNQVIYLGTDVPLADVQDVYDFHQPDYLLSIFTSKPTVDEIQEYVNELSSICPEAYLLLSGFQCFHSQVEPPANGHLLGSFEELMNFAWESAVNPSPQTYSSSV